VKFYTRTNPTLLRKRKKERKREREKEREEVSGTFVSLSHSAFLSLFLLFSFATSAYKELDCIAASASPIGF
jgi:hypothetical protein